MQNIIMTMKTRHIIILAVVCCALSSCFKEEAPNAECDITSAVVHVDNPEGMFLQLSDTLWTPNSDLREDVIKFNVRRMSDLTALSPEFTLTPGATIFPASGSTHDFTNDSITYTVTSEDKNWTRNYKVCFVPTTVITRDTINYDFEHFSILSDTAYYEWSEMNEDSSLEKLWDSGNAGYRLTNGNAKPSDYPTVACPDGYDNWCVRLTTSDTGSFGAMVNKPLAAGNLFLGEFDMSQALINSMKATKFGQPFNKQPTKFTGYYRYIPGEKYQNADKSIVEGKVDEAAVYAVFYRNHDANGNPVVLYGDDAKTSEQIVAIADTKYLKPTDEWTKFEVSFSYSGEVDPVQLESMGYSLAIIFSSSADGGYFQGAIGSTLYIDKVSIICSQTE